MSKLTIPVGEKDHIQGSVKAPVTLIEYGDYECPYCERAYYVVKRIQSELGDDRLMFVFRNFPLTQVHPHAFKAACMAEAVGLQRKFWEMHDELFEHQDELEYNDFEKYVSSLGLDVNKYFKDIDNEKVKQRVHDDIMSGIRSGVNGTPTFYINGVRYDGSYEYDELMPAIEAAYLRMFRQKNL